MQLLKKPSWRDWYNPLRFLTTDKLIAWQDAFDRGQSSDLQWFWNHMEQADSTVQSAVNRRLSFLDSTDWEILVDENADPTLGQEQAAFLKMVYNKIENFKQASRFLAHGLFTGFAHCQKLVSYRDGFIYRLDPLEQWYWTRKSPRGPWLFNPEAKSQTMDGEEINREEFCIFQARPIHKAIGPQFFAKTLAHADWDTALETSANQSIFIVGPAGMTDTQRDNFQSVAESIASNGRGVVPNGTEIKAFDTNRASMPYYERIKYCDEQIVLAATGGLLTMLAESGTGTLAGNAHEESLLALSRSDAARLSEMYQRDIDRHMLNDFFPGQPHAAYFRFDIPQQEDVNKLLESVGNLSWAGYQVDQAQLEEKTGLKLIKIQVPQ